MEAVQRRAREQSQEEQRVRLRQATLAARHADAGRRVVVVREEDSTDPRLTMALNATPEGSAMVVTSVPSQQPPPETLDLGASLWANSLLLQRGGASAPVVGGEREHLSEDPSYETSGRVEEGGLALRQESSVLDRAGGVLKKSKSAYLRRLKLLPPSVGVEVEAEGRHGTGLGGREGMLGVASLLDRVGGGGSRASTASTASTSVLGTSVSTSSVLNDAMVEHAVSNQDGVPKKEDGRTNRKHRTRGGRVRPKSSMGRRTIGGGGGTSGVYVGGVVRSRSSSSLSRGSRQRPSSAANTSSGRKGRAAVRDTRNMLKGLSMGKSGKFAGTKRSQSSFAAKLQQRIVNGRRSQRLGALLF